MSIYYIEEWYEVGLGGKITVYGKTWKASCWSTRVKVFRPVCAWLVDSSGVVIIPELPEKPILHDDDFQLPRKV